MRLQARFLLLFALVFVIGAGAFVTQHTLEARRLSHVQQSELGQESKYFDTITGLEGQAMEFMQTDYSFWDEMVAFVKSGDPVFAQQNVDTAIDTYNTDAAWVYRPNDTLVYHANSPDRPVINLPLPAAFFDQLRASKLMHFFVKDGSKVIEVRAATIVPSDDGDHATPAQGYWVVARALDSDYVDRLSDLVHGTATLSDPGHIAPNAVNGTVITVSKTLNDWTGKPVAGLSESHGDAATSELNHLYTEELLLFIVFAALCIMLVVIVVWWQVIRPIRLITGALKNQHPEHLDTLARHGSEFGRLAATIQEFFHQKVVIQEGKFVRGSLERLNREKTAFLATAAHELNSPVNTIKIIAEFLMEGSAKDYAKESKRQLGIIEHLTKKMALLISDMRAAKLGQFAELAVEEFDFDDFLDREIAEASYTSRQKIVRDDQGTGAKVVSDPGRLSQVVNNLLRNADKYSPNGQQITVRSGVKDGQVIVVVQDSGIGISAEDQLHIFNEFFRAEAVKGSYPGLGLGLSIAKKLIDKMGGRLWVESALGKGSRFYFSLPMMHTPEAQAVSGAPAAPTPPPMASGSSVAPAALRPS